MKTKKNGNSEIRTRDLENEIGGVYQLAYNGLMSRVSS